MKKLLFLNSILLFLLSVICVRAGDASNIKADLTVDAGGKGDVETVGEAIAKVSENNQRRFVIFIKSGVYKEQIRIPANKPFISLVGESADNTKLTFNLANKDAGTTSASYSFYVGAHDFYAENLTFENSFGQGSQAVAVLSEADRIIFKNCKFLGWQDTLYAKNGRQYFVNCYVAGAVDFVFGQAAAVFDNCEIHSKGDGYIAAPMRFAADEASGFVFINCKLTGENTRNGVFLGRPWRDYGRTIYIDTQMDAHIRPEGWNNWLPAREKTAYFAEYNSSGAGAQTENRVKWSHQLTGNEVKQFSSENFLKGADGWNPKLKDFDSRQNLAPVYQPVTWKSVLARNGDWYQTDEAARIADQVIAFQKDNGGWEKNIDMAAMLTSAEKDSLVKSKFVNETTIDNDATHTQIRFLARIITASLAKTTPPNNFRKYKESFDNGLDFLFAAQYANGGFPQFYPLRKGYYAHITYNDDAMIGVLELLRDVAEKKTDFAFVEEAKRVKAKKAVQKGIEAILKTQIVVRGEKTVWCAQHDETSFAPASARTFEPISLSGYESVGVVRFLMGVENPNRQIVDAIESAVKWFEKSEINGIRIIDKPDKNALHGFDRVVVKDSNAPPLWARFYDIETNRPIFSGRDSVIKYNLSEIEEERRNGYRWYVAEPNELLNKDYPKWLKKIKKD